MDNFLRDQSKFQKTAMISWMLNNHDFLNVIISQEKCSKKSYKKFVDSDSMSKETERHMKLVGTRPRIMCGSCKVHKNLLITVCLLDQFYLLYKHINTSLQSFLVLILEPLTANKYKVKESFNFTTEIADQDLSNFTSWVAYTLIYTIRTLFMLWKKVNLKIFYL